MNMVLQLPSVQGFIFGNRRNSYDLREYSQINTGFNPVEYSILYHFSHSATKQKILE